MTGMNRRGMLVWSTVGLMAILVALLMVYLCRSKPLAASRDSPLFAGTPFTERGWQGIYPGVTSVEEASSILERSPYVELPIYTSGTRYQGKSYKYIRWFNKTPCRFHDIPNEIIALDDTVVALQVCLDKDSQITVDDVVTGLGEPEKSASHEAGGPEGAYASTYLLYPEQGFALETVNGLAPTHLIVMVYYFEPTTPDELRDSPISQLMYMDLANMEDWVGYVP
jgi:hypothetical protein